MIDTAANAAHLTQRSALGTQHLVSQSHLFQRLRWRLVRNAGTLLIANSRVRLVSIVLCSLIVAGTVFAATYEGFYFLRLKEIPFSGRLVGTVFDFLFLALAVLLVFSGG